MDSKVVGIAGGVVRMAPTVVRVVMGTAIIGVMETVTATAAVIGMGIEMGTGAAIATGIEITETPKVGSIATRTASRVRAGVGSR